jgi:4-alpha-glucanotransferase
MRSSGILMHVSSLPGNHGIGSMGRHAYAFVDFLKSAGQRYWQILPLCPTGYGNSPYQCFSTYAGNPYLIDLDLLVEEGLLYKSELDVLNWGNDPARVDFSLICSQKLHVLREAFRRYQDEGEAFARFRAENDWWLPDYALFMALKEQHGGKP